MSTPPTPAPIAGRGANVNPANRFERLHVEPDGEWLDAEFAETGSVPHPRTQFYYDGTESILTSNDSPDIGPGWSLNCYRGCEHGCAYCFARPYHDYLGWSSGIDFETKILVTTRAHDLLREELASRRRQELPPLEVDFDVLEDPEPLVEAISRDVDHQLELLLSGEPRNAIVACWERFEEQAERVGLARKAWETSSEFTIRLLDVVSADESAVSELAQLYREARFSDHTITEESRRRAVEALGRIRDSVRSRPAVSR